MGSVSQMQYRNVAGVRNKDSHTETVCTTDAPPLMQKDVPEYFAARKTVPTGSTMFADAMWTQAWAHGGAVFAHIVFYGTGLYYGLDTCTYQGVAHLALAVLTLKWIQAYGTRDPVTGEAGVGSAVNKQRNTNQYWHACLWALIQHLDYFIIFMCRNMLSTADPKEARPERAMENEVSTLNELFLEPLGFEQSAANLTAEFGSIISSWCGSTGTGQLFNNGELLFWYQIYEGTIHGLIIVGALVHLFGLTQKNKYTELVVFWCYEVGMILELATYGPSYFWIISVMFVGAWCPSFAGLPIVPGNAVKALATVFATHHHIGYCLDTWGCFQICKAWGLTPKRDRVV